MNFKTLTLALAAALSFSAAQAQVATPAPSLNLAPNTLDVHVGDSFSMDVMASNFANPMTGGGFGLSFNAAVLQLDSVSIPANWDFRRDGGLIDNASGTLAGAYFSTFVSPKAGSFQVGTLNFKAIGIGSASINLMANVDQPFTEDVTADTPVVAFKSGLVNVAAVPEPSSVALALAGVGLVGWSARRRQQRG
jgi:hypothetical protein